VGGFMEIVTFLGFLGFFFSKKLFLANIAKSLYLLKRNDPEQKEEDDDDKEKTSVQKMIDGF